MRVVETGRVDWAGEFSERSLENEYLLSRRAADDTLTRTVILGGAMAQLVFAYVDRSVLAGSWLLAPSLGARALVVVIGLALAIFLPRISTARRSLVLTALVFGVLPLQAFAAMTRQEGYVGPLVTAVMHIFFSAVVLPVSSRTRFVVAAGTCLAHAIGRAANPTTTSALVTVPVFALCTALVTALSVGITLQRSRRHEFLALREQHDLRASLERALAEIKTLRGIVPICAFCKSIRDEHGQWHRLEVFVRDRTHAEFSHGFCPTCAAEHYPEE